MPLEAPLALLPPNIALYPLRPLSTEQKTKEKERRRAGYQPSELEFRFGGGNAMASCFSIFSKTELMLLHSKRIAHMTWLWHWLPILYLYICLCWNCWASLHTIREERKKSEMVKQRESVEQPAVPHSTWHITCGFPLFHMVTREGSQACVIPRWVGAIGSDIRAEKDWLYQLD